MKALKLLFLASALILVQAIYSQETKKVAIIGNSITEGSFLENPVENSYPGQLAKMLPEGWEVGNFGVSGRTMLKKGDFPIWNEQKFKDALNFQPDIVTIMLGTNDSKPYNWVHGEDFYADFISMIDTFENLPSHPKVIIVYPPKAFTSAFNIDDKVIQNEIIPVIKQISEERNLQVIDSYSATTDKSSYFNDGIHPNLEGARFMAEIFYKGLTGKTYK